MPATCAKAEALARALGRSMQAQALAPRAPWRWLAPYRLPGATHAFGPGFGSALALPPALAIGCGRGARSRPGCCANAAHAWCRSSIRAWTRGTGTLVIAPEHDGLHGANVLPVLGSLNPVDDAWLADAAALFPALLTLPRPRTALLVGGPTRHAPWRSENLQVQLEALRQRTRNEGGSLLATVSRRTPAPLLDLLRRHLQGIPGLLWDGSGANPYPGMLACADRIICTPDSVNMLSEACATSAPVYVPDPTTTSGRIASYLRSLQSLGRIRAADDALAPFDATALRETARVAAQVRERLAL
ncbi:mitochondrial fission ELM1 family protein [Pseudoxanthomonas sp. NC8]|nr:mitochondrial fission ELM1 family protein [Pseudoxanthomonas sp. NC8]